MNALKLLPGLLITAAALGQSYTIAGRTPLPGNGAWDYLAINPSNTRVYVSHADRVSILDAATAKPVAQMSGFGFIHGIAFTPNGRTGFLSDGYANEVIAFDPATNRIIKRVPVSAAPNSMALDPTTHQLFVGHKPSNSMTVLSTPGLKTLGTIALGGSPEFPVADGRGHLFVNLEDTSEIVQVDAASGKVVARWPLAPCKNPSGLAYDAVTNRLFSVCDNKTMVVVNAADGHIVTSLPIGDGPDAVSFDPGRNLIFVPAEDGTLTIIAVHNADHYSVQQTLRTEPGARTMTLDPKTHTAFLSSAKLGPPAKPTRAVPHPVHHPTALPGTFHVLVIRPSH
jgi:DNA-binding beta-propeller fold protein YncE